MSEDIPPNEVPKKALAGDFPGRFREIISDPINLLIERHPMAGTVEEGLVTLHNGHRVPLRGPGSYYETFSDILIYNRGVHEPLEEWAFQEVLKLLPESPVMLELGAYWGHYSMWMQQQRPDSSVHLVEPAPDNLDAGRENFARHGYRGQFLRALVGRGHFTVDDWMERQEMEHLDILHSDIQGHELDMIAGAATSLGEKRISYLFVSTHGQDLHQAVIRELEKHDYRMDISADFDSGTSSFDGMLLATRKSLPRPVPANPPGRVEWLGMDSVSRVRVLDSFVS